MAPTTEQALRAEIQAHKQALQHVLKIIEHHTAAPQELRSWAHEQRDYIRLHLAGWGPGVCTIQGTNR